MQSFGIRTAKEQLEDLGIHRLTNPVLERLEPDFSVTFGGLCESSAYMKH